MLRNGFSVSLMSLLVFSPRFRAAEPSLLGPAKYRPEQCKLGGKSPSSFVGTHSGKMLHTAPRFPAEKPDRTPAPGFYKPKHTLTESRHNIG